MQTAIFADGQLREETLSAETGYSGSFLQVVRETVKLPNQQQATREYIKHPGAVMVLPLFDDNQVLLERQWRTPMRRVMLEFPAGKIDEGEHWFDCAVRELREECGLQASQWAYLTRIHNAIAYSDEVIHLLVAKGFTQVPNQLDEHEFLETMTVAQEQVMQWIQTGEISDVKTIIAAFWLEQTRKSGWKLDWKPQLKS